MRWGMAFRLAVLPLWAALYFAAAIRIYDITFGFYVYVGADDPMARLFAFLTGLLQVVIGAIILGADIVREHDRS